MWKLLSFCLVFVLLNHLLYSQSTSPSSQMSDLSYTTAQMNFKSNRVVPPSPDAASLGTYGNVPVSLFTGTPNIQVPLYELKGTSLSLPISLSYKAAGFKPQDVASWVGLGWTLNAGGAITRSVIANPDNSDNYFNNRNNSYRSTANIPVTSDIYANYDFIDSIQRGWNEMQPDVYYYNFAGYSGQFWIASDKKIIRKDKNSLKISCQGIENDPSGVSYFQILDENGNKFRFDQVEVTYMLQNDITGHGLPPAALSYMYPSTWYLSSITAADGTEVISFGYVNTSNPQNMFSAFLQNESYSYYHNSLTYSSYNYEQAMPVASSAPPITKIYYRKYLQSITLSKSGVTVASVNLTLGSGQRQDLYQVDNPGEKRPESLMVSSDRGTIKKYNFYYSYFTNSVYTGYDYKRLRLDSVADVVTDGSGLTKPSYSFVYDNSAMQSLGYGSIDHWGFSNGGTVTTLVPRYATTDGYVYGGGAIRDAGLTGSMTAVLKQINYPTGGYTSFTYELNQAYEPGNNQTYDVGGLRIKQMIDYSFSSKAAVVKNYSYYSPDGNSSGRSYFPNYVSFSTYSHTAVPNGCSPGAPCIEDKFYTNSMLTVSASSVAPLGTIAGSHIGYTYVTESQTDANTGVSLGRTVYHYKIGSIGGRADDISNGDLLDKSVYNLGGKLLSSQVNTYNYTAGDGSLIAYLTQSSTAQDNKMVLCRPSNGTADNWKNQWEVTSGCASTRTYTNKFGYSAYTMGGQWKQSLQEVNTVYDQVSDNYIVSTKKYTYGSTLHIFPTLTEQYSSSNDEIVTSLKYAGDYTVPGTGTLDAATLGIKNLQDKNMLGRPIETLIYRQSQDGTNKRYIDGTLSIYDPGWPKIRNVYRLELASPITAIANSSTNGSFSFDGSYKVVGSISYDVYGNLSEESKAQDVVRSYIWGYNHSFPVAEVVNGGASTSAYTSFETGTEGGGWTYQAAGITAGGRAGDKSFNLSSTNTITISGIINTRTYIVSYYYKTTGGSTASVVTNTGSATAVVAADAFSNWKLVEYQLPAGSSQVTISSSTGCTIDELKLFPKDAQMTSYTFTPLVGMTSQCNPANQYLFYEYDGFARLVNVLDMQRNIVKNYKYNYGLGTALTGSAQTLFYNVAKSAVYQRTGCPAGTEGTNVTYVIPYGKYVSSISQADADAKATADLAANGSGYAIANGKCLYWNTVQSGYFTKTCLPSEGTPSCVGGNKPFNTLYQVPAHTYSSEVSQAAADALAQADVAANGPGYVNTRCTCTCSGEGQKVINSVCTSGTRVNTGTSQGSNGKWTCTYHYEFSDGTYTGDYTQTNLTNACPLQ